jgi:hypothetical protein
MSRVYNLLSKTVRPSVIQVKRLPQTRRHPFARLAPTRPPVTEVACVMCLNNSRRLRARVRFALGSTALFIRTSLEKTGLWRPLLNFLSSSVGTTAAKLIGIPSKPTGPTILTICPILMLPQMGWQYLQLVFSSSKLVLRCSRRIVNLKGPSMHRARVATSPSLVTHLSTQRGYAPPLITQVAPLTIPMAK